MFAGGNGDLCIQSQSLVVSCFSLLYLYCIVQAVWFSFIMETNACQSSSSFGDIKQGAEVQRPEACQQKLCYQTVDGSVINLDVINHQPSVCQEFVVTSPKFNYYRWMAWTVGFYVLGCVLQLHLQVYNCAYLAFFVFIIYAQDYCSILWLQILILLLAQLCIYYAVFQKKFTPLVFTITVADQCY